jgi:hypothetical protein
LFTTFTEGKDRYLLYQLRKTKSNSETTYNQDKLIQDKKNVALLLPVAILWKITGIGSVVTNTSSSFSELDTYVLSEKKYD